MSAWGVTAALLFEGLLSGGPPPRRAPLRPWPEGGTAPRPTVATVDVEVVDDMLEGERLRALSRETRMALLAAKTALSDAGLDSSSLDPDATGAVVSTRHAGLQDYAELLRAGLDGRRVNPGQGPQTGLNGPASYLSIRLGAAGPNATVSNGAVGGFDALAWATDVLERGSASTMLVCGVDVIPPVAGSLFASETATVPRPFDRDRSGPVHSEAAVALILESDATAKHRRATPWAVLDPIATAFSPGGDTTEASMRALRGAFDATETTMPVAGCFAGANGSVTGDACEARALYEFLDRRIPLTAIKGGLGEAAGASATAQVAVAAMSLGHGAMPPTAGHRSADPGLPALEIAAAVTSLDAGPLLLHGWDGPCAAAAVLRVSGNARRGTQS